MRFGKSSKAAKALAVVLALAMTASMSVVAFGDCVTTTTYNTTTNLYSVKSEITGVTPETPVTYVALAEDGELVYIDQDAADGNGDVSFEYATDLGTVATVSYGAKAVGADAYAKDGGGEVKLGNYTVTYTYDETKGSVEGAESVYDGQTVTFTIAPKAGYVLSEVIINGENKTVINQNTYSFVPTKDSTVQFFFKPVEDGDAHITSVDTNLTKTVEVEVENEDGTVTPQKAAQVFATVTIPENNTKTVTYGVIFSDDASATLEADEPGTYTLQAGGNIDGNFVIRILKGKAKIDAAYVCPYVCVDGVYTYGDVECLSYAE